MRKITSALFCAATIALTSCGGGSSVGPAPVPGGGSGSPTSSPGGGSPTPTPHATNTPSSGSSGAPTPVPTATPTSTPASTATGNAGSGIPFPAATDPDTFYAQPSPFPNVAHGTILASRSITYQPNGISMTNAAYQLKFASQDIHGRPIAAVETVVKPAAPATGTEPLYVLAFPEDALGPQCAPSHWATGSTADSNEVDGSDPAALALAAGWTLAMPDIEGPYSLYAVGPQEGYIVLDAEKAALAFAPLGLNAKTPIGANGYSGGAHAVSWADAMQPTYGPNLNLVATASARTPADILGILESIDGTSALSVAANEAFFDIIYMSGVGINRAFPNFLTPVFNAAGTAAATAMENGCIGKNSDGSGGPTGHFSQYVTVSDLYTAPGTVSTTTADSEPQKGLIPKANTFIYQSATDELIPVAGVDKLVNGWCAEGSPIQYYRASQGGDHVTMDTQSEEIVFDYFNSRFGGSTFTAPAETTTCNE